MRIAFTLLLFFTVHFSIAQNGFVRIGFQSGLATCGLGGDPNLDFFLERDLRFTMGPSLWVPLKNNWSFRTQLAFCPKGAKGLLPLFDEDDQPVGLFEADIRFNYLSAPLLLEKAWGRRLQFTLKTGPYIGLMLSHSTTYTDAFSGESFTDKSTAAYVPWDGGIVWGSGLRYNAGKRLHFALDMQGEWGIANIASKPVLFSQTLRQNVVLLQLGIFYAPAKKAGQTRGLW